MEISNLERVSALVQNIPHIVMDENTGSVMGEMVCRFESRKNGWQRLEEAFVQKWKDGKIIYQRFYYEGFISELSEVE